MSDDTSSHVQVSHLYDALLLNYCVETSLVLDFDSNQVVGQKD